jgi:hypothetical protein
MTERERQINQGLHALDDAHRLGRIARDEYRLRRRHLLAPLIDETYETVRDTVRRAAPAHGTSRRTSRQTSAQTSQRSEPAAHGWKARAGDTTAPRTPPLSGFGWRQLALSVCVLGALGVAVGLLCWLMLRT